MLNIKEKIKEGLDKLPKKKYDYGCVMVNVDIDNDIWQSFQDNIDNDDLYNDETNNFGRELTPHITVLYGIHKEVPDEDVENIIKKIKNVKINLKSISSFENKLFDVLKFDVDCKDLHKYNKMLKKLPYTNDYPNYHPHMTISYLKKGLADKYIDKFSSIKMPVGVVSDIIYSKPNGKKNKYVIKND